METFPQHVSGLALGFMISPDNQFSDEPEQDELDTHDKAEDREKEQRVSMSLHRVTEFLVKR